MSTDLFGEVVAETHAEAVAKITERGMLNLLGAKFGRVSGNGPRYATAEHVRSTSGNLARCRIIDFMAQDTWDSGKQALHGFEVKVSRSDWLTELRDPDKANAFRPYMNHWWLVVADKTIVRDDLPHGWGLMVKRGRGLSISVQAPLQDALYMPVPMRAALMRATAKTSQRRLMEQVSRALNGDFDALPPCDRYIAGYRCKSEREPLCPSCRLNAELTDATESEASA